jgi:MFS transporter, OFA family, oxalate/formate antiporter
MTDQKTDVKVMNRWIIVIGAIMIQVALGAIYAWSAFTGALQSTAFGFSKTETQAIFSAGLATFAIFTIIGGRLAKKYSPRIIALLGGVFLGLGYILASFVGANFALKLILLGIMGGAGIGLGYVVPIAVGVKWFPDKKGLVSGLAVAGFGFGAFIWILMANPPSVLGINGFLTLSQGSSYTIAMVDNVFLIYGIAFMALVVIGSLVMINPPKGWLPKGYKPAQEDKSSKKKYLVDLKPKEMLHTRQFYLLWMMFFIGALAGLMVIGNIQNFATSDIDGFAANPEFSSSAVEDIAVIGAAVCLPIFNGIGRIVWGKVSDNLGRKKSLIIMCILQGIMMLAFFYTTANPLFFYVAAALIGFNFGANFALFPAATADSFGSENVGLNYGFVFTSYGVGGIVGPILAGMVKDAGMSYMYAFVPAAILCFVAAGIALIYKPQVEQK